MEPENYSLYCRKENLAEIAQIIGNKVDDDIIPQDCEECEIIDYDETIHQPHQTEGMVIIGHRNFSANFMVQVDPWDEDDDGPKGGPSCQTS